MSFKTLARLPDPHLAMRWNWTSSYPALAKLNLFLHVTGRRQDGYHLLQTLFRFVELKDCLRFSPRSDDQIVLANPIPGVPSAADLTVRAAESLRKAAGIIDGVTIHLTKNLPMGGGLGGGSSDAATVLIALNYLWGLGGSRAELQALALPLGADVPVFVFGQSAFAEGVGEQLSPVALPNAWYLIVNPGATVPTASIFTSDRLQRNTPEINPLCWESALVQGVGANDLESVAVELHPAVGEVRNWLMMQPESAGRVRMTGSGACVFAVFDSEMEAKTIQERLPSKWQAWVAQGMDKHPLHALLSD